jgi:hypothetical protein
MYDLRFAVVKMSMLFFWVVTPRGLVGRYQCFGETQCLHLQCSALMMETVCFSETSVVCLPTSLHGVTTQKDNIEPQICPVLFWRI